jgi:hypothetical protein
VSLNIAHSEVYSIKHYANATFNNISAISWLSFYWWRKLAYPEKTTDLMPFMSRGNVWQPLFETYQYWRLKHIFYEDPDREKWLRKVRCWTTLRSWQYCNTLTQCWLLTDSVCLYTYEFWLSLCKIVRSSVILLLPLFYINT